VPRFASRLPLSFTFLLFYSLSLVLSLSLSLSLPLSLSLAATGNIGNQTCHARFFLFVQPRDSRLSSANLPHRIFFSGGGRSSRKVGRLKMETRAESENRSTDWRLPRGIWESENEVAPAFSRAIITLRPESRAPRVPAPAAKLLESPIENCDITCERVTSRQRRRLPFFTLLSFSLSLSSCFVELPGTYTSILLSILLFPVHCIVLPPLLNHHRITTNLLLLWWFLSSRNKERIDLAKWHFGASKYESSGKGRVTEVSCHRKKNFKGIGPKAEKKGAEECS